MVSVSPSTSTQYVFKSQDELQWTASTQLLGLFGQPRKSGLERSSCHGLLLQPLLETLAMSFNSMLSKARTQALAIPSQVVLAKVIAPLDSIVFAA